MTTRLNNLPKTWSWLNVNPFSAKYVAGTIALLLPLLTLHSCTGRSPEAPPTAPTSSSQSSQTHLSHYSQYIQRSVNRPSHYPLPSVPSAYTEYYHPIGDWTGRLILPKRSEREADEFVWFEIQHAPDPYQAWIGSWAKLRWQDDPDIRAYVQAVTTDVQFTSDTWASQHLGRVHPTRLEGLENVGPLESLAGARAIDDVVVKLVDPVIQDEAAQPSGTLGTLTLAIAQDPVQITGRWHGLVKILGPVEPSEPNSRIDSQIDSRRGDRFWVQHFNSETQQFDGPTEQVHLPQAIPSSRGVYPSTTTDIEASPLNEQGWYVYGDRDATGTFVVQAIEPRQLMQPSLDQTVFTPQEGLAYIRQENWAEVPKKKGTGKAVLIVDQDATDGGDRPPVLSTEQPPALVIHAFGGIGGEKAEPKQLWTTTGHFSYGIATVVLDPLTNQPRLWIEYYQVYANNPSGIVSGVIHWSDYMGNLQRGWLGTRPVSDVLVSLEAVTQPYQFDTIVIDPLAEFKRQLTLMAARYRTGNGTGASIVTPATSCVQDSNQALYATIQSVKNQIQTHPTIQQWLNAHPDHPQTQRFQSLVELGHMLENQLTPLGLVRSDWQENAEALAGIGDQPNWSINRSLLSVLRSWRTLLPRRAHDELTLQLLTLGHTPMHIIRTNQIGGDDPTIEPLAPTTLLGF